VTHLSGPNPSREQERFRSSASKDLHVVQRGDDENVVLLIEQQLDRRSSVQIATTTPSQIRRQEQACP
jgi:hypothetical protein